MTIPTRSKGKKKNTAPASDSNSGGNDKYEMVEEDQEVEYIPIGNKTLEVRWFHWKRGTTEGVSMNVTDVYVTREGGYRSNMIVDEHGKNKKVKYLSIPLLEDDEEWDNFINTLVIKRFRALGRDEEAEAYIAEITEV